MLENVDFEFAVVGSGGGGVGVAWQLTQHGAGRGEYPQRRGLGVAEQSLARASLLFTAGVGQLQWPW